MCYKNKMRGVAFVWVCVVILATGVTATWANEPEHVSIQCDQNGQQFTCAALGAEAIAGTPYWLLHTVPQDDAWGYAYTGPSKTPRVWTLLEFTLKDSKNNVHLKLLVRYHNDKIQFAATGDAEQTVK